MNKSVILRVAIFALILASGLCPAAPSGRRAAEPVPGIGVTPEQLAKMKRRLAVLNATTNRPVTAVIQSREAKATFRDKHRASLMALEQAEFELKPLRDVQKAAKRSQKNIEKVVKTLEQAKKKAASEDEAALYQSLIDILTTTP